MVRPGVGIGPLEAFVEAVSFAEARMRHCCKVIPSRLNAPFECPLQGGVFEAEFE